MAGVSKRFGGVRALSSADIAIEAGRIPDPRVSTLRALARALGVPMDELAGEEDEPAPEEPPPAKKKGKEK